MTKKQIEQFNRMRYFLLRINKYYMTPAQIEKKGEKMYGLSSHEVLEMAYENIQAEAKHAVKGVKQISLSEIASKKKSIPKVERSVANQAK